MNKIIRDNNALFPLTINDVRTVNNRKIITNFRVRKTEKNEIDVFQDYTVMELGKKTIKKTVNIRLDHESKEALLDFLSVKATVN